MTRWTLAGFGNVAMMLAALCACSNDEGGDGVPAADAPIVVDAATGQLDAGTDAE